jgi:hypothetical protein
MHTSTPAPAVQHIRSRRIGNTITVRGTGSVIDARHAADALVPEGHRLGAAVRLPGIGYVFPVVSRA